MPLSPITRAKIDGDLAETTRLSENLIAAELNERGARTVWVTADDVHAGGGFRVAVIRRDATRRLHRVGTMKVFAEKPLKGIRAIERDSTPVDLPNWYSVLTGSRVTEFGFEVLPSSWFEALFRNRSTLRHLRRQLIAVLGQIVRERTER